MHCEIGFKTTKLNHYNQGIMSRSIALTFLTVIIFVSACQPSETIPSPTPLSPTAVEVSPTQTVNLCVTPVPSRTEVTPFAATKTPTIQWLSRASPTPTFDENNWTELPVVPTFSATVMDIYQRGLELGNHPNAFSKVGDCGSTPSWFLGDFDRGDRFYNLGEHTYLKSVIDYYQGSFGRTSLAALAGYNTSSVLTPLWSNKEFCANDESPLACEYRLHRPVIALITLGANDVYHLDSFEPQLRKIIEFSIEKGVIPVLATKPDNIEKDHRINKITARLAYEYQIPLWNYWKAVQSLPNRGLQEDGVHITFASNDFSNPINMQAGWPVRNLTALQVLYALYNFLYNPQG